jgi:gamma-glutamyl:cysteine ligase YbdK (ATP-grasp superfamily)
MGQEIAASHFRQHDFQQFQTRIDREMELLRDWFRDKRFSCRQPMAGAELEAWLVDESGLPVAANEDFLERVNLPTVVPELSKFNIEFNVDPQPLAGTGLERMEGEFRELWNRCDRVAADMGASVLAIGILPTVSEKELSLQNVSAMVRFRALNEQVFRVRQGRPLFLDIVGRERLSTEHRDVMLEAGATSFQVHLQVPLDQAVRYYNAATIVSALTVAVAANSPFLFGKQLWEETRIPLFEQAVDLDGPLRRVTLGSGFVRESLEEVFLENVSHYSVLLPFVQDVPPEFLPHVRLHNGTIWRWNRPLIGFDADGQPHLRIEHRVLPAGPTLVDMAANMAFFYGIVHSLANASCAPESRMSFSEAWTNFYEAARLGLRCHVDWYDGRRWELRRLILDELLKVARQGLEALEVDAAFIDRNLAIIEARVASGRTGSDWQRQFVEQHGRDWQQLACAYRTRQRAGAPVHTWDTR